MAREITNYDDVIDSRDVIDRIEELEDLDERDDSEQAELEDLKALEAEAEGYSDDWKYGSTLIRDSYFERYAEELAEEVGDMPRDLKWPLNHIDWKAAAEELKQDYTEVTFGGVSYWVR